MSDIVERLNVVRESFEAGCDDWPIVSQIWEYKTAAETIESLRQQLAEKDSEIERLSRQNSSYSNLAKAQEGQLTALRNRLYELKGADKTLDSERDANAILTEQLAAAQQRIAELESDPAIHFAHRFAVVLECMTHSEYPNEFWNEATILLSQYHEAQGKWREAMGEPYVSGFGKD